MSTKTKITVDDIKNDPALKERFSKSLEVARAIDAKAPRLPYSRVLTSYEFEDFIAELTPKRLQLLRLAARGTQSISELAAVCHRDPSAVSKDISRLQELGLLRVELVANAGHGKKKVVTSIAETILINASLDERFALAA